MRRFILALDVLRYFICLHVGLPYGGGKSNLRGVKVGVGVDDAEQKAHESAGVLAEELTEARAAVGLLPIGAQKRQHVVCEASRRERRGLSQ